MKLENIFTPALVLERTVMQTNIDRMADRAAGLGINLRPHVKTPKSIQVADLLLQRQAKGITVSTLNEAEYFFSGGIKDIFYAVSLAPNKVPRMAGLLKDGAELKCLVDNLGAAKIIADLAVAEGIYIPFFVEVDVDQHRSGVEIDSPEFVQLARFINDHTACEFVGVMAYGGASYECESVEAMADLAEHFKNEMLRAKGILETAGLSCNELSFGSTPAIKYARDMSGITELRCGIYTFEDLFQAGIGACKVKDIALSVLTTVIGHQQNLNRITVDAGGLALSKDRSTRGQPFDAGYGLVCEAPTGKVINDLYVADVSQELGLVTTFSGGPVNVNDFPIGSQLRILPNHSDMTAAAYEQYYVVEGNDAVRDVWHRTNRW